MKLKKEDLILYAVTDSSWIGSEKLEVHVEKAILGGATFIQYREKELNYNEMLKQAIKIKEVCKKYKVPFIVNDNIEIAIEIEADGVHLGQLDFAVKEARRLLGKEKIIGATAKTIKQAIQAQNEEADYIGSGAVFGSKTKLNTLSMDLRTLKEITENVKIPVVAIGGINKKNVKKLKNTGISGIAVVSGIFAEKNIEKASRKLKRKAELII